MRQCSTVTPCFLDTGAEVFFCSFTAGGANDLTIPSVSGRSSVVDGVEGIHHSQRPLIQGQRIGLVPFGKLLGSLLGETGRQEMGPNGIGAVSGFRGPIELFLLRVKGRDFVQGHGHYGVLGAAHRPDPQR